MTSATPAVLKEPAFTFLRDAYLGEVERCLKKAPYKEERNTDADDQPKHLLWRIVTDSFTNKIRVMLPGMLKPVRITAPPPVDPSDPDQFEMVAHEAVKRQKDRGGPLPPEYRWLRYLLVWDGLPCLCNCAGPVAHLAMIDGTTSAVVEAGALEAAQGAVRFMDTAKAVPKNLRLPREASFKADYRRRADIPADAELPFLSRVYAPCGATDHTKCPDHF